MLNPEAKLRILLESSLEENLPIEEEDLEAFAEACKQLVVKQFLSKSDEEEPFRLRMSNIGQPLRKLHLEREYGRTKKTAEFKLMMCYGDLTEALLVLLLKTAGVNITGEDQHIKLPVSDTTINGTYDIKVGEREDGVEEIIDIKSCSPYAFDHKFESYGSLKGKDDFGYLTQGYGYAGGESIRTGKPVEFGGLFVMNKVNGHFKYVEAPRLKPERDAESKEYAQKILATVKHFENDEPIPECEGVLEESYYQKKSGREFLCKSCEFCDYKDKCHPGVVRCSDKVSQAKKKPVKYYTKLLPEDMEYKEEK